MSTAGGAKPVNKRTALTEMVFGLAEKRNTAGERPAATDAPKITDAQVPASSAAGRGIVGLRFEPALEFHLGILYPSHRPLSRAARSFLALLRAHRNDVLGRCALGKQSVLT